MNIAIVRKKYTFHGGAESFSSSFTEKLADEGHEVHIYAIQWQTDASHEHIHFHKVPALTGISFLRDLTFALSSYVLLRRQRSFFDVIQTHDKTLYQDIYRAGDGCHVEWLAQRWKRTGPAGKLSMMCNPYHWLIRGLEKSILSGHRFRKVIAISEMVKKNVMQHYGVAQADIEVIYNGVDLARFHPQNRERFRGEIRDRHHVTDRDFVILLVGSGFERKGVRYLLQAVESLTEPVTLLIVGKGSEKQFRASKRQKIVFCGPRKDIDRYYAAADIFVFPALYEPFGNVHLEALASGLPVITTENSGAAEIIEEGKHGFVIDEPENINALAGKILYCMHHRDDLTSMSQNARQRAEEFSYEKHLARIKRLYEDLTVRRQIKT